MKKLWLALLFLAGGFAHEVINPVSCQCISVRQFVGSRKCDRPTM
jgi:phosphatidylserine decarboxylase